MIYCKCDCINSQHGECTKEDVVIDILGCLSFISKDNDIYEQVLEHYGDEAQVKQMIEELKELSDELTVIPRKRSKVMSETADVLNMIRQLNIIHEINNEELAREMERKMRRTLERIRKENN